MKDPVKTMLLGIAIMIVSLFSQNLSGWQAGTPSAFVQIVFVLGSITTLAGFFYEKN